MPGYPEEAVVEKVYTDVPNKGLVPKPIRTDIEILYQGFVCASVSFSKTLGTRPDRGQIELAKSEIGKVGFVAQGKETSLTPLGKDAPSTFLPSEAYGESAESGKGFAIAGNLELRSPYGSILLPAIYIDKPGQMETQVSEDRGKLKRGEPVPAGEIPPESQESAVRVNICDERVWWESRGIVSGRYNIESNFNGAAVQIGKHRFERRTVRQVQGQMRPFSLMELIQICVASLPPREFDEQGTLIPVDKQKVRKVRWYSSSSLSQEFPLNVTWDGELASKALDKLLGDYKLHLNLRYDGDVDIVPEQFTFERFPEDLLADFMGDIKKGICYDFKPPSVIVVGNRIICETTTRDWLPVVQWDGSSKEFPEGAIVPLSYALDKWGYDPKKCRKSCMNWFDGKDGKAFDDLPDNSFKQKRQKILKEEAYQWFQAIGWQEMVPIREKRIEMVEVQGIPEFREIPWKVKASFFEAKKEKDEYKGFWRNNALQDAVDYLKEVDKDLLVLKFKQPMGIIATNPELAKDEDLKKAALAMRKELEPLIQQWMKLVQSTLMSAEFEQVLKEVKFTKPGTAAIPEDWMKKFNEIAKDVTEEGLRGEDAWKQFQGEVERQYGIDSPDAVARYMKWLKPEFEKKQKGEEFQFGLPEQKAQTEKEVQEALAELRKHADALLPDASITNLHICDFFPPLIEFQFMYEKRQNADAQALAPIAEYLLKLGEANSDESLSDCLAPHQICQLYSDRYTFVVGQGVPEVIPMNIQLYLAEKWNNKKFCDMEAAGVIARRFASTSFRDLMDTEFAGFHPISTNGYVTSVSWDSDGELARTQMKIGDYLRGIDQRLGIYPKEKRDWVVTRMPLPFQAFGAAE
jgi:hypothetical protein